MDSLETQSRLEFVQLVRESIKEDQPQATLEALKALYERTEQHGFTEMSCDCAMMVSTSYNGLRDWENSITWAQKALQQASQLNDVVKTSTAAGAVVLATRDKIQNDDSPKRKDFEDLMDFLKEWVERDGALSLVYNQIDKLGLLSNIQISFAQRFKDLDKHAASESCLSWLEQAQSLVLYLPEEERLTNLAEIWFKSFHGFLIINDYANAIGCLELARMIFVQAGNERQASKMQLQKAHTQYLAVMETLVADGMTAEEFETGLNKALRDYEAVEDALLKSGLRLQLVKCHLSQALLFEDAYQLGDGAALREALNELNEAETINNDIRSDMTIQKNEEMLKHKAAMVSNSAKLFELGLKLSWASGDHVQAWNWIQKGKSRAYLDLLSYESSIPTKILDGVHKDSAALGLWESETQLLQQCEAAPSTDRFLIRQKIAAVRRQMSTVPSLYDLLLYRGMETLELGRLNKMFLETQNVLCVDWTVVEGTILMFTVRPGGQPKAHRLEISEEKVSTWVRSNLKAEYMRQPRALERLRELDSLIAPLSKESRPGDLLVLCPARAVSALPFHALELDKQLLLERNPVIYSSSLSVLHHCLLRQSGAASSLHKAKVFGNPSCDRPSAEASSRNIATRLTVNPYIGTQAVKQNFQDALQDASIFHYHGHAAFDAEDPLQSAFKLSKESGPTKQERELTVREILQLRLSVSILVMIACESAQQDVAAGEEPTGLLPMLILAGVNSAIGTLWKCSDIAGKEFTEAFYNVLLTQFESLASVDGCEVVVNLATALQQAALLVRQKRPAPYYWALFVLYGNWQCAIIR